jgi:hypothetical protein
LVSWALHLMQRAVEDSEFSLMLAGLLVACAAAALLGVYVLMESYWSFMEQVALNQAMILDSAPLTDLLSLDVSTLPSRW